MSGSLSTLGIGSGGTLSYDLIDQLKEADESAIIAPIDDKIELNSTKQEKLDELKQLITDLKDQSVTMTDTKTYASKDSSINGDSISANVTYEAKEQTIEINVSKVAKKEIYQSQSFASKDSTFTTETKTMTFTINGTDIEIDVNAGTTISDLADLINEKSDGLMEASVLNVGGTDPYKLIYKSTGTGEINNITRDNTGGLGFVQIQNAADAEFEYDGIDITSSSNEISDLIEGVTITLKDTGVSTLSITQNSDKVVDEMKNFVEKYNAIIESITELTKYDSDTSEAGIFQSTSEIKAIKTDLNDILATTTSSDKTIVDFGFTLNRDGTVELDEDELKNALNADASAVEEFFKSSDSESGVFDKLYDTLFDIGTSSSGTIKTLSSSLDDEETTLEEAKSEAQTKLDDKYDLMAKQFVSFDIIIGRLTKEFESLDMIIQAEINSKS